MSNIGFDAEVTASPDASYSGQTPRLDPQNGNSLLRGVEKYVKLISPSCRNRELQGEGPAQAYKMHRMSFSLGGPSFASMPSFLQPSSRHSSAPPQAVEQHYTPFLGRFRNSADAKDYRRTRMRFGRIPWREPKSDPTIPEIEHQRERHVERIYNAMVCGDHARDNAKSTALKRWVHEPHYQSDLVEAYAHKVFDCLLEQVKEGFRGWHQNDYVNDERKGEDDDKDIDCAGRLDNIITALEQEKSICENVMSSAWQIRMFVNAPKAYSKRKDQNRVGNSKRPNAKCNDTSDDNPRATKRAKTAARCRRPLGRSSTASELPLSQGRNPQLFKSIELPCITTPTLHRVAANPPVETFLAPQAPSMSLVSRSHRGSFDQLQVGAVPGRAQPHTSQPQNIPHITSIPPTQQSAFSSQSMAHSHSSALHTPDEVKPTSIFRPFSPWPQADTFVESLGSVSQHMDQGDNSNFAGIFDWSHVVEPYSPYGTPGNDKFSEQHPEMGISPADVELMPTSPAKHIAHDRAFTAFWQQKQGIQQLLPYTGPHLDPQSQP
jgi:hypothetical protein